MCVGKYYFSVPRVVNVRLPEGWVLSPWFKLSISGARGKSHLRNGPRFLLWLDIKIWNGKVSLARLYLVNLWPALKCYCFLGPHSICYWRAKNNHTYFLPNQRKISGFHQKYSTSKELGLFFQILQTRDFLLKFTLAKILKNVVKEDWKDQILFFFVLWRFAGHFWCSENSQRKGIKRPEIGLQKWTRFPGFNHMSNKNSQEAVPQHSFSCSRVKRFFDLWKGLFLEPKIKRDLQNLTEERGRKIFDDPFGERSIAISISCYFLQQNSI